MWSLTIRFNVFQSIEREEPIEVDPAPAHNGQENGHAAPAGNYTTTVLQPASRLFHSHSSSEK